MKFIAISTLLASTALARPATTTPNQPVRRAGPTIYTCGDSTMAKSSDGVMQGWGEYLGQYTTAPVVNKAIGGRSARSYWDEGRFTEVADLVVEGDVVVMEFGHNDGGSPESNDNGRSDCPGDGTETCVSDADGSTVYTFVYYVTQAAKMMMDKGATVVLASQTPNNLWETGEFEYVAPRFVEYQKTAAEALGEGASFVDHFNAVALMYEQLGFDTVSGYFPNDHTHTSPDGAEMVAKAFVQAISESMNGTTSLVDYIASDIETVY